VKLPSEDAAVLVSLPAGAPLCTAMRGEDPSAVVWLLLDPSDIDCKQTTFVRATGSQCERIFADLYKLSAGPARRKESLVSVREDPIEEASASSGGLPDGS